MPINNISNAACSYCNCSPHCLIESNPFNRISQLLVKRTRHFARNETLCVLNDRFQNIYIIKQGAVKAYQVDINGHECIHAFYFSGEMFGYRAIHTGHYISTVVALTDTLVCEIPYDQFVDSLQYNLELSKHFLSLISRQLSTSSYVDIISAENRVAAFLIDMSLRIKRNNPMQELVLPMSRQDIGNYLRLTAETVSRILSRLQKNKLIIVEGKSIRILNPEKHQSLKIS